MSTSKRRWNAAGTILVVGLIGAARLLVRLNRNDYAHDRAALIERQGEKHG